MRKEFYTEDEFWLIMYSKMKLPEFCEFIGINYPEFIKSIRKRGGKGRVRKITFKYE